MQTKSEVLNQLAAAKQLCESLAKVHPNEAPWRTLLDLLNFHERRVRDHWPLTTEEKESCKIGWFSVKNIESVFPELHAKLSDVAYGIRHSGEENPLSSE